MRGFLTSHELGRFFRDGMTVMVGGFLANGSPERLVSALLASGAKDLVVIANDGGWEDRGVGRLIVAGRVKKLIASHIGTNPSAGRMMQEGSMKVELVPQGTLAERIRAHGAGLGGVLTPTGLGTVVQEGKRTIEANGREWLFEEPLGADVALLGGAIADRFGNLSFRGSQRNFNPVMATAAAVVLAEPYEIKDALDPEYVVVPHPLVDYVLED